MSQEKAIRLPAQALVDVARSIPFLMLAYLVYYGLPSWGVTLDSWTTAASTIAIYNTAYIAEILRGAWANLPPGQTEAARAYRFIGFELLRRITLPQIVLTSAPVIGNQLIQVIKDSAFLSVITIPELTFTARAVQATYFVPFESFIVAALLYWMVCLVVEYGIKLREASAYMKNCYIGVSTLPNGSGAWVRVLAPDSGAVRCALEVIWAACRASITSLPWTSRRK
jgi:polar amino acid transport system permease protein